MTAFPLALLAALFETDAILADNNGQVLPLTCTGAGYFVVTIEGAVKMSICHL